jgi:hypothetical protein
MDPIGTAGAGGITAATPRRVFLSHTSDFGLMRRGRWWPPQLPPCCVPAR